MLKRFKKLLRKSERGQAIILIALAIVGLVSMVGLVTDGGILLIEYARLKRGIDAAAISAALQFRKGFSNVDLENSALEFLRLNQSDVFNVQIDTCDTDASICTVPIRKLVKVTASKHVQFGFMRVLGITETDISAFSVGEAASIDLALVMDTSLSMAYETHDDTDAGGPTLNSPDSTDDPSVCNASSSCEPLESIKAVAKEFIATLFFPYDRVAIVTMTSQDPDGERNPTTVLTLNSDQTTIEDAIDSVTVFEPVVCPTPLVDPGSEDADPLPQAGSCLNYPDGVTFAGFECPRVRTTIPNPSSCTSSNVGGALTLGGAQFTLDSVDSPMNEDSFWVIIALIGGPANASDPDLTHEFGYCPDNTHNDPLNPFCRDADAATRHGDGDSNYDAEDFARDRADALADPVIGNGITIFTIGLGNPIRNASKGEPLAGEILLQYVAQEAGDDPVNDPDTYTANHGQYFYSPDSSGLADIFALIAQNIFTRLSQ